MYNSNNNNNKSYARYTEANTTVEGLRKEVMCVSVCSLVPACNSGGGRVTDGRRERVMERAERARGGYIIPIQKTKLCLHCGEARAPSLQCYRGPRAR